MTATDMWNNVRLIFEDMASMSAPGYTPFDLSVKLTQAQEELLLELRGVGFDKNEDTRRIFSSLIKFGTISGGDITASGLYANSYTCSLSSLETANDYWFAVGEFASATNTTKGALTEVTVRAVEHDEILQNIANPYKKPCDYRFWKATYNGNTLIITDGSTLTALNVTYLRKPVPIIVPETATVDFKYFPTGDTATSYPISEGWEVVKDSATPTAKQVRASTGQNCELDDSVHLMICERAAKMIYESIKDVQGYQIAEKEEND